MEIIGYKGMEGYVHKIENFKFTLKATDNQCSYFSLEVKRLLGKFVKLKASDRILCSISSATYIPVQLLASSESQMN